MLIMGDYGPGVSSLTAQSPGNPPISGTDQDEISVLVTGFGVSFQLLCRSPKIATHMLYSHSSLT